MKKNYSEPTMTAILLNTQDVITVSITELTLIEKSKGDNWDW